MTWREEDGVVLIVALWAVILFSVIATGLITLSRTERSITRNTLSIAQARAIADAGITKAIITLITHDPVDSFRLDGTPKLVEFGGAQVEVSIQDELGKVDLNFASEETLTNLFVELRVDRGRALALAAAIADWRDEDDIQRPNGAERAEYIKAGLSYGPANSPFRTIAELERVLGFDRALVERTAPYVTVFSRRAAVSAQLAAPVVRAAYRTSLQPGGSADSTTTDMRYELAGRVFTITAQLPRTSVTRQATFRFTGNSDRPTLVQNWK